MREVILRGKRRLINCPLLSILNEQAIMNRPGFTFGWALGFFEMAGTCVFSSIERWRSPPKGVPSISAGAQGSAAASASRWFKQFEYAIVCACLMSSSSLSNIALNYITYPTKVCAAVG